MKFTFAVRWLFKMQTHLKLCHKKKKFSFFQFFGFFKFLDIFDFIFMEFSFVIRCFFKDVETFEDMS